MIELKFTAQKPNGQIVNGNLAAGTYSEGKKQIKAIVEKHKLKLKSIQKKVTFIYKIKKGNETPTKGEQRAFSKEEVVQALTKMGYQVISVNKYLFEWSPKPPQQEILSFVKISAELLEQKLPYSEIMTLLVNDLENKTLRETLKQINNELKKGADSQTTFIKHERVFGKFTAYMLGLAAKSGNMTEIYKATAKFLERRMQFSKDLRSALITPAITMFVLLLAVLFYVGYIFPETAKLFLKFDIPLPPLTAATLSISDFLINQWPLVLIVIFVPPIVLIWWNSTPKGNLFFSKYMMKAPIIGGLVHKTNIEVFCRVFYTLYSGSAESIEPIRIASEATDNAYFEQQIKKIAIPMMIRKGAGISESFAAAKIFTDTAISRFHSGEETGTIKNTALQLANYYESETVFRLKNVIEMIQVFIAMAIMVVMIGLTLVSAETATINPSVR
ncbi:MAG: type II secretion system F family protein [Bacteroidetes bacterium]|nr:type II secretion system F family protein [Bacteroidota bacterium]MBU1113961.1 type II secretion system F family protein [Bacteroidota bacterium]MBU1797311.1 type II secretion system F family protein [Bacteroidota bacterium]